MTRAHSTDVLCCLSTDSTDYFKITPRVRARGVIMGRTVPVSRSAQIAQKIGLIAPRARARRRARSDKGNFCASVLGGAR
jgi:hypothetical protein